MGFIFLQLKKYNVTKNYMIIMCFFNFSNVYAKDIEQLYWILDEYVEN